MRIRLLTLLALLALASAARADDGDPPRVLVNGGLPPRQAAPPQAAPPRRLPASPEGRREALDRAVLLCGEDALPFCREFSDAGILVCLNAPGPAKALAELYRSGELQKVCELPRVIAACCEFGGPVCQWVAENHKLLTDPDAAAVFLRDPREAALGLVDVARRADALRQARERERRGPLAALTPDDWKKLGLGAAGGAALAYGLVYWKRRREGVNDL